MRHTYTLRDSVDFCEYDLVQAQKSENQSSDLAELEQMVNLYVKVPISQRRYWMSKAKEQGITVTSVIVEALIQKFGEPENQETRKP